MRGLKKNVCLYLRWAGVLARRWFHRLLCLDWILQVNRSACCPTLNRLRTTETHPAPLEPRSLKHASLEAANMQTHFFYFSLQAFCVNTYIFRKHTFTFRNSVIILPQWIPLASWMLENIRSLVRTRAYATRLLLLSSHTKTSGAVCWGCIVWRHAHETQGKLTKTATSHTHNEMMWIKHTHTGTDTYLLHKKVKFLCEFFCFLQHFFHTTSFPFLFSQRLCFSYHNLLQNTHTHSHTYYGNTWFLHIFGVNLSDFMQQILYELLTGNTTLSPPRGHNKSIYLTFW